MMSQRPSGSAPASASKMRSEPETWSARVMTARPPAFSTRRRSPRNRSPPRPCRGSAACARRMTCTIIGSPAMSASGLPGSRVEAMRAGMTIRMRLSAIGPECAAAAACRSQIHYGSRGYTGCQRRGKPAICAPSHRTNSLPSRPWSEAQMNSFEMNKILGAVLGTCLGVGRLEHRVRRGLRARQARQARIRHRGAREGARRRRSEGAGAAGGADRASCSPSADIGRGRTPRRSAASATPSTRAAGTCVGPNLWGVVGRAEGARSRASTIRPGMKAKGGNWTVRRSERVHCQTPRPWFRAPP